MKLKPANAFFRKRVGEYELGEVLGEGTFATVRRAKHVKSGLEYAVKCLDKSQIEKQKMGKQLKREIAIMRIIKHPRVVRFYEVLASKTKIYLVLEVRPLWSSNLCIFINIRLPRGTSSLLAFCSFIFYTSWSQEANYLSYL